MRALPGEQSDAALRLRAAASVRIGMKLWLALCVMACSARREAPPPTEVPVPPAPQPPPAVGVLFERIVVGGNPLRALFATDGTITVEDQQWNHDGTYRGRYTWARNGQLRPVAVAGTTIIGVGWRGLDDMPAPPADDDDLAWLVMAEIGAAKPTSGTAIRHTFHADNFQLSPDATAIVTIERDEIVVHAVPAGTVLARAPRGEIVDDDPVHPTLACWIDDATVAWFARVNGAPALQRLAIRGGALAPVPASIAGTVRACDPAGGVAAIATADSFAMVDLASGRTLATHPRRAGSSSVAVGAGGRRLAIATARDVTLFYRTDEDRLEPLFTRTSAIPPGDVLAPEVQFSHDGSRLAVTGPTLLVIGPASEVPPARPVPHLAFELPAGFAPTPVSDPMAQPWGYAQLPRPSMVTAFPALLVAAASPDLHSDVVALAVEHAELPQVPPLTASDAELTEFAKRAMARLFGHWVGAKIGTERDADFTLRVGRTDGRPWFETRELVRDGCEPHDAYTRVVIDREVVFIVRALTPPAGSTQGWLSAFFDLPFQTTKTARRPGPRTGPC